MATLNIIQKGTRFSNWEVIERDLSKRGKNAYWICKCHCGCGTTRSVNAYSLTSGKSTGCGRKNNVKDLTDMKFNSLKVIKQIEGNNWLCECDCGERVEIQGSLLVGGYRKTCGNCNKVRDVVLGEFFDNWEVVDVTDKNYPMCMCKCGTTRKVSKWDLIKGKSKGCGCNSNKFKDLTDLIINEWKVLEYSGNGYWKCECSCGATRDVHRYRLISGLSTNCGHIKYNPNESDVINKKIHSFHVNRHIVNKIYECECECGKIVNVNITALLLGKIKDCGHSSDDMIELTGKSIGCLDIIERVGASYGGPTYRVKCKICGKESIKNANNIRTELKTCSRLCGKSELTLKMLNDDSVFTHVLFKLASEGNAIDIDDLCSALGVSRPTIESRLDRCNCRGLIKHNFMRSKVEDELADLIQSLGINIVKNDRKACQGMEIDIYLPEYRLGIEFNGVWWHSDKYKDKQFHLNKTQKCEANGIKLIHIFEDEYLMNKEKVLNLIYNQLGLNKKIAARKCSIENISKEEAVKFIDENHLQGNVAFNECIGLIHNGILVQIMTFGQSRFDNDIEIELLRMCSKQGISVIGGASKLFKHYVSRFKPSEIVSYCDISKFNGKVYEELGFKLDSMSEPGYRYLKKVGDSYDVKSRYQCQKHKLLAQGYGSEEMSEEEIMRSLGYIRIYNCGNKKYIWRKEA